jgi:hypothetical protein
MLSPIVFGLVLAVVLALAPRVASAEPTSSSASPTKKRTSTLGWLRMPGADACVATQALARGVETRLGRTVFVSPAEADVSVEGRIEKKGTGFAATLVLRDSEGKSLGTRTLEKADPACDKLTESLVLIIAVMIDPDAAMAPAPTPAPASPTAPPAPPAPAPAPAPPAPERIYVPVPVLVQGPERTVREAPALRFDGSLSARFAAGIVPFPAIGGSAVGVLVPRKFIGILGRASLYVPSREAIPGSSAEVSFVHGTLGSGLCPLAHVVGPALLTACGEGDVGLLMARPSGLPRTVNETRVTVSAGASFAASFLVSGPFTLRAGLSGMIPLVRESFEVTLPTGGKYEVFRQAPATIALDLGFGLRLP